MRESLGTDYKNVFKILHTIFNDGIANTWLYVLANGKTTVYDRYGIINICVMNGVTYLNSGAKDNGDFTYEMWRDMLKAIKSSEKMVIQSTLSDKFPKIREKYGFRYNSANNSYEKGK